MKKFICILAAMLMTAISFAPLASAETTTAKAKAKDYSALKGTTLNVFNWGEYISDGSEGSLNIEEAFEKKYGITVNYTTYESNESLYNKLVGGGANYDVIVPSDYIVQRLIAEERLEELDFSNIPNYKNIQKKYKNLYFDPDNKHSVPYAVGMVGLIYNKTMVDTAPTDWKVMWNNQYAGKILMFNNPRDAFGIAQFVLGQDVNTTDENDWQAAAEMLKQQKPLVASYVMDEVFNKMESGAAAMAPYYAGDYLTMVANNPDLGFVYPKEGTNAFVDSMCIPKGAENKEAAELFINFMLQQDIAVANANFIGYASPNQAVLGSKDYDYKDNEILYPENLGAYEIQYFENLDPDTLKLMTGLWDELKVEGETNYSVYIGLAAVVFAAGALIGFSIVRKKRRTAEV